MVFVAAVGLIISSSTLNQSAYAQESSGSGQNAQPGSKRQHRHHDRWDKSGRNKNSNNDNDGSVDNDDDDDASNGSRWQPDVSDTWQWQLDGTVNTTYAVNVYDIDLFDSSAQLIRQLHDGGHKVVCYFSAGSSEAWRPDNGDFNQKDLGNTMDGWEGETWLDIRSANVRKIMQARLDLAKQKGCDGVEPDNIAGYSNATGFPLTAEDQLDYNRFLAQEAHDRNLAIALKNDIEQAADLVSDFDFSVNEQCHEYDECDGLAPFINAGKPVFNAEYAYDYNDSDAMQALCADALNRDFRTLVLPLDLDDSFRYSCDRNNESAKVDNKDSGKTNDRQPNNKSDCRNGRWYTANLTNYTSYPDPGSEECVKYNGCQWAGQFYGLEDQQTKAWVKQHNIVSVHLKDWNWLGLKTIKLRQGDREIIATVYDACADADCDGCCTENLGGDGYLIDMEKYTMERFGSGEGTIEFQVCE